MRSNGANSIRHLPNRTLGRRAHRNRVLTSAEEVQYFEPANGSATLSRTSMDAPCISAHGVKKPNRLIIRFRPAWLRSFAAGLLVTPRRSIPAGWIELAPWVLAHGIWKNCERAPPCSDAGKSLRSFRNVPRPPAMSGYSGAHREDRSPSVCGKAAGRNHPKQGNLVQTDPLLPFGYAKLEQICEQSENLSSPRHNLSVDPCSAP